VGVGVSLCLLERRDIVISGLGVFLASFLLLSWYWIINPSLIVPVTLASILVSLTAFMVS